MSSRGRGFLVGTTVALSVFATSVAYAQPELPMAGEREATVRCDIIGWPPGDPRPDQMSVSIWSAEILPRGAVIRWTAARADGTSTTGIHALRDPSSPNAGTRAALISVTWQTCTAVARWRPRPPGRRGRTGGDQPRGGTG